MDMRRSFYLASKQDDFDLPLPDDSWVNFRKHPLYMPANDNVRAKESLSTRCVLRRLIALLQFAE